jgi:hypothetical protein
VVLICQKNFLRILIPVMFLIRFWIASEQLFLVADSVSSDILLVTLFFEKKKLLLLSSFSMSHFLAVVMGEG